MTQAYHINDTLTLISGSTVVVRKVITQSLLRVSFGFDSAGNDILGLVIPSMIQKNNSLEHKQYLIDSIADMQSFIDKIINRIYEQRDTISESTHKTYCGIIDRKKESIAQFRQLLASQYNHSI